MAILESPGDGTGIGSGEGGCVCGGVCGGADGGVGVCSVSCVCDDGGGEEIGPLCVQEHKPLDSSEINLHAATSSGPDPTGKPRERQQ